MKANQDIRAIAREHRVRMWEIAMELGIQESYFSKKMRQELPEKEKKQIVSIIERLSARKEG